MQKTFLITAMAAFVTVANAQTDLFKGLERFFTTPESYVVPFANHPPFIDGNIEDNAWKNIPWTKEFRDIEGTSKPIPYYPTKAKMLWDKDYLYIAAQLTDKHVWGTLTEHDQVVYYDHDFEVFIDPSNTAHNYFEIEINVLNTIFDLFLSKPYRSGANVLIQWDCKGLKHAVNVQGSLNDSSDEDTGWTVEMAIPYSSMERHAPRENDIWRLGFSRVEWEVDIIDGEYVKKKQADGKALPEHNWVWSPTGAIAMHMPERWGYIQFAPANSNPLPTFQMPYKELQRQYLWLVFHRQQEYRGKNKKYAATLAELKIPAKVQVDGKANTLKLDATQQQYILTITDSDGNTQNISHEGKVNY
ncbi:hypothetical protein FACS189430_03140 [Bacteroidia bacterium]|nr:hypothetical protein FACS189430_03140 [Bacteroidia bacterium]